MRTNVTLRMPSATWTEPTCWASALQLSGRREREAPQEDLAPTFASAVVRKVTGLVNALAQPAVAAARREGVTAPRQGGGAAPLHVAAPHQGVSRFRHVAAPRQGVSRFRHAAAPRQGGGTALHLVVAPRPDDTVVRHQGAAPLRARREDAALRPWTSAHPHPRTEVDLRQGVPYPSAPRCLLHVLPAREVVLLHTAGRLLPLLRPMTAMVLMSEECGYKIAISRALEAPFCCTCTHTQTYNLS